MDKEKINNELKAHREYVVNRVGAPLNWSGEDLRMADLKEVDFRKANLSGADLTGADLTGADLTDANLTGADLSGAVIRDLRSMYRVAGDGNKVVSIKTYGYEIAVTEHQLQVGCKIGTHEQWKDEGWRVENLGPLNRRFYVIKESVLWGLVSFVMRTD